MSRYRFLKNHNGEILKPGTLIQIVEDTRRTERNGSIFQITEHLQDDKYSFKIIQSPIGTEEYQWNFHWEFNYQPECIVINPKVSTISIDKEYEDLWI